MENLEPFQVIAAPFTVWLADVGTDFPKVDTTPNSDWFKLGTSGDKSYTEDGVSIAGAQTLNPVHGLGATLPIKTFRSQESIVATFSLMDMTLEHIRHAFNSNAVTDTAAAEGTPGYRTLNLERGLSVTQKALLIRGPSPYFNGGNADFRLPRMIHEGEPEFIFKKDEPALCLMQWAAQDDDKDYELIGQDAVAI